MGSFILLLTISLGAGAQDFDFRPESAGGRFGFSAFTSHQQFYEAEAFANWRLPWQWQLDSKWSLRTRLTASAGSLTQYHDHGFIGTLGPGLRIRHQDFPVAFVGGVSGTVLSRTVFETKDFGIPFQFTENAGFEWEPYRALFVGYRFQHMSNAGLGSHNAGLNLHMFSVGLRF